MNVTSSRFLAIALCAAATASVCFAPSSRAMSPRELTQQTATPSAVARRIGAVKAINGTVITLAPDSGPEISVTVQGNARIVRIPPGEKDLKNATPIQLQDLQIGDRILVGGKASDDNLSLVASTVVVMKRSDLDARHQQDLQDWQKRGVGGLVSAVDPAAGTVTISITSFTGKKNLVIHASKTTVIRRYAPGSAKFDDAKSSTLQEIHPGDQVSARGDRNPDGTELTAEEIVSGDFRNVAGTINSVDASSSTISVQDLLSKKTVLVKITQDSLLRQLPPEMAQRIAMRFKAAAGGGTATASGATPGPGSGHPGSGNPGSGNSGSGNSGSSQTAASGQTASLAAPAGGTPGNGAGGRSGGAPDFQQMINRMPAVSLAELHKGDAVMIVATAGTSSGPGTAIKLISGVEPIFRAAPSATAAQSMMLGSWSLGGGPSGDAGGP